MVICLPRHERELGSLTVALLILKSTDLLWTEQQSWLSHVLLTAQPCVMYSTLKQHHEGLSHSASRPHLLPLQGQTVVRWAALGFPEKLQAFADLEQQLELLLLLVRTAEGVVHLSAGQQAAEEHPQLLRAPQRW